MIEWYILYRDGGVMSKVDWTYDWYGKHLALWPSATLYWGKTFWKIYFHFLTFRLVYKRSR